MDVLWLIPVGLVWLAFLKWVGPRFKQTGCGSGKCAGHPHSSEGFTVATPVASSPRLIAPTSPGQPVRP